MSTVHLFGVDLSPVVVFLLLGEAVMLCIFVLAFVLAFIHKGRSHHFVMLSAFLVDMLIFKPVMISNALKVWGPYPWPGGRILVHFWLDLTTAVLGITAIYLGFKFKIKKDKKMFMPRKGRTHRLVGALFLTLWFSTFALGIWVFVWAHIPA